MLTLVSYRKGSDPGVLASSVHLTTCLPGTSTKSWKLISVSSLVKVGRMTVRVVWKSALDLEGVRVRYLPALEASVSWQHAEHRELPTPAHLMLI